MSAKTNSIKTQTKLLISWLQCLWKNWKKTYFL